MDEKKWLADQFEANRPHLRAVAYRMLGSVNEAEDAVQEGWLRLSRAGGTGIDNLGGWLTTTVARVCLDMLRTRRSRREEPLETPAPVAGPDMRPSPEHEAMLADSVGLALLVVLQTLAPAERVAFVLHDMFDLSFDEIAPIVGRSPTAARQLASRGRRRVQGRATVADPDVASQRKVVDAFLAATRRGDVEALVALLDPDVVLRADAAALRAGASQEARGAAAVATALLGRRGAQPVLVDGAVGLFVAPGGRLRVVLRLVIRDGRIADIEAIADPDNLRKINLGVLPS
ncbi:sigma-70 family RNA polymerase sigma factor [Reyranella sp. CPCC 100927]|uniref:sigma-70 family RNA polymerase sigma factor n=1 Tax=Reyranella sp. CPCC 100927 TaxID=2599616 RepID=UPI0011B43ADD|nr:sigma-70 family RNA polymerase sigma factor [Reyranella sp. CPCC 100927]TWS96152.1 sigma-70 family RNA polymerase sigma factor [Reyranella sp. CPCC 100927]